MKAGILAGAVLAGLIGPGAALAEYRLHILHINDLHSRIEPINAYDSTCAPEDDAAGECFGGIARVAAKIAELREELTAAGENVIVLDAGDQFQGSLFYTTYKGSEVAAFMNAIGFDAMTIGNHEFDDGPEGLADFLDLVEFPVIAGNLDLSGSNLLQGRVPGSVILELGAERIGIVSALTVDTVEIASPGPNVTFTDEIESLRAQVAALEEDGIDKIVALTHVGYRQDLEIAGAVPGIDAVVGGHSHTFLSASDPDRHGAYPTWVDAGEGGMVPVVQAYAFSKYLGHLVVDFDDAGNVTFAEGDTLLLDASVTPDPVIAAMVEEMAEPIAEVRARVVAEAVEPIEGSREACRQEECAMGNLVADAQLDRVRDQGIVISLANGGGLRASIGAGEVTMGDVLSVLPFQNTLSTFEISGEMVLEALENGVSQIEDGAGRFLQVAGLRYAFDPALPAGTRVSEVFVEVEGGWVPLDQETTYGAVTNNYVRTGGDGFWMFEAHAENAYDFGPDLADVTAEYLAANTPYTPYADGRITRK